MNDIRDAHYALGKAYLNDSQYAEAIPHIQAVLNLDVNFIDAYHALALAYFGQHELQEAKNAAQDALRIDPTYEPALSFLQAIVPQDTNVDTAKQLVRAETTAPDTAPVTQEDQSLPVVDTDTDKEMEQGVKVGLLPKSIGGLRYEIPDRKLTIRKNGFETIRIPITADHQARTKKVPISIQVLDKTQSPIATTEFHLNIKSK